MTALAAFGHDDEEDGPKSKRYSQGSEDGEMADVLEAKLGRQVIYNHGKAQWHRFDSKTGLWLPDKVRDVPKMVDRIARAMTEAAALSSGSDKDVLALVKV